MSNKILLTDKTAAILQHSHQHQHHNYHQNVAWSQAGQITPVQYQWNHQYKGIPQLHDAGSSAHFNLHHPVQHQPVAKMYIDDGGHEYAKHINTNGHPPQYSDLYHNQQSYKFSTPMKALTSFTERMTNPQRQPATISTDDNAVWHNQVPFTTGVQNPVETSRKRRIDNRHVQHHTQLPSEFPFYQQEALKKWDHGQLPPNNLGVGGCFAAPNPIHHSVSMPSLKPQDTTSQGCHGVKKRMHSDGTLVGKRAAAPHSQFYLNPCIEETEPPPLCSSVNWPTGVFPNQITYDQASVEPKIKRFKASTSKGYVKTETASDQRRNRF